VIDEAVARVNEIAADLMRSEPGFAEHRGPLHAVAYRVLGSVTAPGRRSAPATNRYDTDQQTRRQASGPGDSRLVQAPARRLPGPGASGECRPGDCHLLRAHAVLTITLYLVNEAIELVHLVSNQLPQEAAGSGQAWRLGVAFCSHVCPVRRSRRPPCCVEFGI
jgi:hypothetical protein